MLLMLPYCRGVEVSVSNILSLSFPMGSQCQSLFCPACGAQIVGLEMTYETAPCPHLDWIYVEEVGEFLYASPAVQNNLDQWESEALEDEEDEQLPIEKLVTEWSAPTKAHIAITTRGIACGPVSSTLQLGINFLLDED